MQKAIIAFVVTIIMGIVGIEIGLDVLSNIPSFGAILAVAVMGAFIIYFQDKKQ